MKDTAARLSPISRSLHWLIAFLMIGLFILGKYISMNEVYALMPTHKSLGIIVLVLASCRLLWRYWNGWPSELSPHPLRHIMASLVHWVLLLSTILFPLSGAVMSVAGGRGLSVFGVSLVEGNFVDGKPAALFPELSGFAHDVHTILPALFIIALALHVVGAIYHHLVLKDATLSRMLGR